ncbi:hypothetical protein C9I56_41460 [Paraburkholderia caribensis]|uniref:Uncharacterized protein n=4 Tax=Paraburkholderia TaxID=1822464 RepID=B2JXU5_PARP8|nr:conserved hypothetical protein [Paraburkholderia phymatum STM815]AFT90444.1 hypothetical protein BUPH_06482 [Paraburkholderia phenoliruptrix BR3459a]PTB23011.1 hypothetical protein C9I56_41460 [Paraburkholderia caribensis]
MATAVHCQRCFRGNTMKLTSAKLIQTMELGRGYQAGELARRFDTSSAQINDMLCTLVEEGLVRMSSHSSRIICFERLSLAPRPPSTVATDVGTSTTVATPPITRQMHGSLRGYEASLASVRSLAMLARPSR